MGTNGHELSPRGTIFGGPLEGAPDAVWQWDAWPAHRRAGTRSVPTYGLATTRLGTKHLDQRSAIAVAIRRFKTELTAGRHRVQETVGEVAIRNWLMVEALDDWLLRQPPATDGGRNVAADAPTAPNATQETRE